MTSMQSEMNRLIKPPHHAVNGDAASLFQYTSGRWLWNEEQQMRLRYRHFNAVGLQQIVSRAMNGTSCISIEKIGEGNYNKAYRLVIGDGRRVVAKIPNPNAGPPMFTTASEVATMDFARTVLGLPVPKVLAWDARDQNAAGTEYIIMEEATGSPLHEVWKSLSLRAKCRILENVVDIERKLLSFSSTKIGSLYFTDDRIPGCVPDSSMTSSQLLSESVKSRYCVGPIARRDFWRNERHYMENHHGPWDSSLEYLESMAKREIDWIQIYANPSTASRNPFQFISKDQYSREAHIALLQKFRSAIPHIAPKDPQLASPVLWHPDLHPGNIYVDNEGQISSLIDWQGAWLTPIFIGANPPLLLDYGVDILMKLPDDFKQLEGTTKTQLRHQVSESILIGCYETSTAKRNPVMHEMMLYPHGQTLKQLEAFAGSTWDDSLFPLRECLIRIEREWGHFKTRTPCPYRFSDEELADHSEDVDLFNRHQEIWKGLGGIMTDEGYVPNEGYAEAVEIFTKLQRETLGRRPRELDAPARVRV